MANPAIGASQREGDIKEDRDRTMASQFHLQTSAVCILAERSPCAPLRLMTI
ncbi:MAG: hypothetical protein AAFQ89_09000 [Cyanobacteria bacterium J06626_18]